MTAIVHQSVRSPAVGKPHESLPLEDRASIALDAAVQALLAKLRTDGERWGAAAASEAVDTGGLHWCAELEGDSILSSEYLLMKLILGQENDVEGTGPGQRRVGRKTLERIADHLRLTQRADGSWGQYPGSGPDISACVKAYLALKCFGDGADAPHMRRPRSGSSRWAGRSGATRSARSISRAWGR